MVQSTVLLDIVTSLSKIKSGLSKLFEYAKVAIETAIEYANDLLDKHGVDLTGLRVKLEESVASLALGPPSNSTEVALWDADAANVSIVSVMIKNLFDRVASLTSINGTNDASINAIVVPENCTINIAVNGTNDILCSMAFDEKGNMTSVVTNSSVLANSTDGAIANSTNHGAGEIDGGTNGTSMLTEERDDGLDISTEAGGANKTSSKLANVTGAANVTEALVEVVTANSTNVTPVIANSSVLADSTVGTVTTTTNSTELNVNPFQPIRKDNNTNGTTTNSTEKPLKGVGANEMVGIETNVSKKKGASAPDVNLKTIVGTTQTLINSTEFEAVVSKVFELPGNDGTGNEPSTPTGSAIKKPEAALPNSTLGETTTQYSHEGLDSMYNVANGLMHHGRSTGHAIADTFDTFKADHPELVDGFVITAVLSLSCLVVLAGYFSMLRLFM